MNTVAAVNPTMPIRCYVIKSSMGAFQTSAAARTQGCTELPLLQKAPYNCIALNDVSDPDFQSTGFSEVLSALGDPGQLTSVGLAYVIKADSTLQASCSKDPACVQAAVEAAIGVGPTGITSTPAPTETPDPKTHNREAVNTWLHLVIGLTLSFVLLCGGILGFYFYEQSKHKKALAEEDGQRGGEVAAEMGI